MSDDVNCPDCGSALHHVSARARTGYMLSLDRCAGCGGIWFDRWELFPLHDDEVARLDAVDVASLNRPDAKDGPGICPRCEIRLIAFQDANLPSDASIERCRVCEGMWLQRGQLRIVRAGRENPSQPITDDALAAMVKAYSKDVDWSHVTNLDHATHETEMPPPDLDDVASTAWSVLPWIVLQTLFRLLLRR